MNRRGFLSGLAAAVGGTATGIVRDHPGRDDASGGGNDGNGKGNDDGRGRSDRTARRRQRRREAARRRIRAVETNLLSRPLVDQPVSGDEARFGREGNYLASFSKGLPHDEFGEVDPDAYERLRDAVETRGGGDFAAVDQAGPRPLTNPEAAVSYNTVGIDPNEVYAPAPPAFDSAEAAAEMVELYWQALCRDVPFHRFGEHDRIAAAAAELADLDGFTGPTTPATLFTGTAPGVRTGPMVSQFLYKDFERGVYRRDQRLRVLDPGAGDFATDYEEWLAIQNGEVPNGAINLALPGGPSVPDAGILTEHARYPVTGRDLATYVVMNVSQQPYMNAAFILQNDEAFDRDPLDDGVPIDPNLPAGFVDYGRSAYQSLLGGIVQTHKHAAWYHKWRVHRRLRPEAFGGRVHHVHADTTIHDRPAAARYPIHDQLLASTALERTLDERDTALLPQAYPEAGPTHPAYPSGHAVSAGSLATVLKAYFDEDAVIRDPVRPATDDQGRYTELESIDATLTVGGEINKLAANMAYGRDWAGIHYRSDAVGGMRIGERIATTVLRDRLRQRPEGAYGTRGSLSFTTFDGVDVTVTADGITPTTAFDPPLFGGA